MKKFLLRNPLRLVLIAAAALSTTACVVEPAYGPYGYYEPAPTVYVNGYYHSGYGYHHGYHHWRD